jgi:hypothetical protein
MHNTWGGASSHFIYHPIGLVYIEALLAQTKKKEKSEKYHGRPLEDVKTYVWELEIYNYYIEFEVNILNLKHVLSYY